MKEIQYLSMLAQGCSVRLTADILEVNYGTFCRHLREIGYDRHGWPVSRAKATPRMKRLYEAVYKQSNTLGEAAKTLNAPKDHVSRTATRLEVKPNWKLEYNEDLTTSTGRQAELFVIALRVKWLVRDCYKAKTGGKTAPYDLILKGREDVKFEDGTHFTGGSVDVKHCALKEEQKRGYKELIHRWLFSVGNFSKHVKWAALVGFNEDKSAVLGVWMVPGHLVAGHSSIRINKGKSRYNQYLIWSAESTDEE